MSYHRKRSMSGLGDASSCGADQQWDPNYVFNGIKGQCTPKGSPMVGYTAPSSGSGAGSFFTDLFKALTPAAPAPAPTTVYVPQPSTGVSTTTLVVAGGAALLLVALLASR